MCFFIKIQWPLFRLVIRFDFYGAVSLNAANTLKHLIDQSEFY